MLTTVFLKSLRDERVSLLAWSIAVALTITWVIAFWPALEETLGGWMAMLEAMPEAFRAMMGGADFSTARGFLSAQLFSFMLPVMMAVLGIGLGSASIAGEEERGTLTLPLLRPLPRRRLALEKALAMLATVAIVVAVATLVALVGVRLAGMEIDTGEIVRAMAGLLLLGWVLAAIAFAVGAATGRQRIATAAAAAAAAVFYFAATFAGLIPGLNWLEGLSPWFWAFGGDAVGEGVSLAGAAGLLLLTVILLAAGIWRFDRRDLAA